MHKCFTLGWQLCCGHSNRVSALTLAVNLLLPVLLPGLRHGGHFTQVKHTEIGPGGHAVYLHISFHTLSLQH